MLCSPASDEAHSYSGELVRFREFPDKSEQR
jgi:hypothetical protein